MTTTTWTAGNGNFNTAANWNNGVPIAGVDAIIDGTSSNPLTITYTSGNDTANTLSTSFATLSMSGGSLTLQNASAMSGGFKESAGLLDFQNGGNNTAVSTLGPVSQTGGTIQADAGALDISGASSFAGTLAGKGAIELRNGYAYSLNAGTTLTVAALNILDNGTSVTLGTNLSYAGALYLWNNASLNLGTSALTLSGSDSLHGLITGTTGKITSSGTIVADNMVFGGSATLENKGTIATTNGFTLGDTAGSTATLLNDAGAVINFTGDNGIGRNGTPTFTNAGTLEKTGGTNISYVDPTITDTGTVIANSGELYFRGGGTFSGPINGTASVAMGNGAAYTLNSGTTLNVANFNIVDNSTSVTLGVNETYAGNLYEWNNAALIIGSHTLTLSGSDALHGLITGTGSIVSSGSIVTDNMILGGAATLVNSGTISTVNGFTVGDSASSTATLQNNAGAIIDLTGDNGIGRNGTPTFTNAGTLEKTGGTGISYIDPTITSSGTILANSGEIYFRGGGTFTGGLKGTASIALGNGAAYALNTGSSLGVANLNIVDNGTSVTLGKAFNVTAALYLWNNATLNLQTNTLTLSGSDSLHGLITGTTGSIVSSGTIVADNLVLGGSATLENKGHITAANGFTLGDSTGSTAVLLNDAGAIINLTADNGIGRNGTPSFTNAGTLEKTGGTGISYIDPTTTSSGTVLANSGEIYFRGGATFSGAISGTTSVALGNGAAYTLNAGTSLNVANLNILDNSTSVTLGANVSYAGNLYEWNNASINLGGNTLTLSGSDSLFGLITGTGSLVSSGSIAADSMVLGSAVTLVNTGTITAANGFTLGNSSSSTDQILNNAGGVINFTGDNGIGANGTVSITNAGTIEKTAGTGASVIGAAISSSGTVLVDSGAIVLDGNSTFSGAISGSGALFLANAATFNFNAGTSIGINTLSVGDGGQTAVLDVNTSLTDANYLTETAGSTINLAAGTVLTLTGTASLDGLVTGSGTLAFNNTTGLLVTDNLTLGGKVILQNKGLAGQAANMTVGDSAASTAKLQNLAGASYDLTNNNTIFVNGNASITNVGTFAKTGGTGTSVVDPSVNNTGTISDTIGRLYFGGVVTNSATATVTNGGTLEFGNSLVAASGKTGKVIISQGGNATFDNFVSPSETVSFSDNTGTMVLTDPGVFDATIAGFQGTVSQSDTIEIVGQTGLTASYSGNTSSGVLTLTSGTTNIANLHFSGDYTLSSFVLSTSGSNTLITDPPAGTQSLPQLAAAGGLHADMTQLGNVAPVSSSSGGSGAGSDPTNYTGGLPYVMPTNVAGPVVPHHTT